MLNILIVIYFVAADYKIYIQAPYMEVFNIYNIYIVYKRNKNTYTLDQKVFQWAPSDVWPLTTDVNCPVL